MILLNKITLKFISKAYKNKNIISCKNFKSVNKNNFVYFLYKSSFLSMKLKQKCNKTKRGHGWFVGLLE